MCNVRSINSKGWIFILKIRIAACFMGLTAIYHSQYFSALY